MTIRVLVVDDSGFFRRRLVELINADERLTVIDTATNGKEAIEKAASLRPDVITMDYEMPVLDGISAVREIVRAQRTPVLMFSSLTYEGARVTLDALEAGAVDYLPKNFEEISRTPEQVQKTLCERIVTVARSSAGAAGAPPVGGRHSTAVTPAGTDTGSAIETSAEAPARRRQAAPRRMRNCALLVVGASTGGPMALQQTLIHLPAGFPVPIVLVQHMPGTFTKAFADRLDGLCQIGVRQAENQERLEPGNAYLVPGGMQGMIEARNGGLRLRVVEGDSRLTYRPSVDVTLGSAANELGNRVLGVILTGMGADGREGARMLKEKGGQLWAQDEASSVIYGMPMAVAKAGLTDRVLPLDRIGATLVEEIR